MTFSDSLSIGEIGESLILQQFGIKIISFENDPEFQRSGLDGVRGALTHEVKTRTHETTRYWRNGPDIAIETISVREHNVAGWIYTSAADILFYGILNRKKSDWAHLWRIRLPELQTWWQNIDPSKYPAKIARTKESHSTENRIVPFADIPKRIVEKIV